jgi:hypothetical protein
MIQCKFCWIIHENNVENKPRVLRFAHLQQSLSCLMMVVFVDLSKPRGSNTPFMSA